MTAHTSVQPVSLCPWVAATGNILVMQASYRNILVVNPAPNQHSQKLRHLLIVILHTLILLVETDRGFESSPKIQYFKRDQALTVRIYNASCKRFL
jgi:hypothetical protein